MPRLPSSFRLNRRGLLAALVAITPGLLACAGPAAAMPPPLALSVVDRDTGEVLAVHRHGGRSWLAGRPGARYALRLQNQTGGRVLAVLSVDGVNVVTGETASWNQSGYVLAPWSSSDITGWRKSDTAVAAFEFAALGDSYAARTGRPGNVGVIGLAAFLERPAPAASPPVGAAAPMAERAEAATEGRAAADSVAKQQRLGTGHGAREWSVTERVDFERASRTPQAVLRIDYDSLENLRAAGIVPSPRLPVRPDPFPNREPSVGYVPDPPLR